MMAKNSVLLKSVLVYFSTFEAIFSLRVNAIKFCKTKILNTIAEYIGLYTNGFSSCSKQLKHSSDKEKFDIYKKMGGAKIGSTEKCKYGKQKNKKGKMCKGGKYKYGKIKYDCARMENGSTEKSSTSELGHYYSTYSTLYRLMGRLGFSSKS